MTNRERVIKLREEHPTWTLQEIGDRVHLTRERVRQILTSEGKRTRGYFPRKSDIIPEKPLYHFNPYYEAGLE